LYREIIAVCFQIHTKHISTLCGQNTELANVIAGCTYGDQWALEGKMSVIKSSLLMLNREIIAVCSQIHTKHISTLSGQNTELANVIAGGTYGDQWALEG
jgi:L-lactate permease